jgi:protein transport protein SEC24
MAESTAPRVWNANREGNAPPPSYSIFDVVDQGCAGPRYLRCTLNTIGNEPASLNDSNIPLAALIQPLAEVVGKEEGVSLVDYSDVGPFRCQRCKAYVNPFFTFVEGGNAAICNLCKMNNKVPPHYFCPLDEKGLRRDRTERPELSKGVYEFVAPKDYHTREVVTPAYVILLEASPLAYSLGVFSQVISSLQVLLDYLPNPERSSVCVLTYGASVNVIVPPADLANEPQVYCITDLEEPEIPFPASKLLLNVVEDKEKIEYVLRKTTEFYESYFNEQKQAAAGHQHHQPGYHAPSLGAALLAAQSLLSAKGGRILTFSTTISLTGAGKLKNRNDYKIYNTEKEKTLYEPQTPFYGDLGYKLLQQRIGLDLFVFNSDYYDLATVAPAATLTGGGVYYYALYCGER